MGNGKTLGKPNHGLTKSVIFITILAVNPSVNERLNLSSDFDEVSQ